MTQRPQYVDTTDSSGSLDDSTSNTAGWVKLECERCGDKYYDFQIFAKIGQHLCDDCRNPTIWPATGTDDSPLMEFGPLSHHR